MRQHYTPFPSLSHSRYYPETTLGHIPVRNMAKTYDSGVAFGVILILIAVAPSRRCRRLLKIKKLYRNRAENLIELLNMLNYANYAEF